MQQVFARPHGDQALDTPSGDLLGHDAAPDGDAHAGDVVTTPGFAVYEPGEVIITQGERAQYVFHMTAGLADVLVDDVPVGIISPGEIFGAMAALTHADRSATVRARSRCSVVKVPTSQFTDLIKSNPATIHALLTDMANSIVSLNEQTRALAQRRRARRRAAPDLLRRRLTLSTAFQRDFPMSDSSTIDDDGVEGVSARSMRRRPTSTTRCTSFSIARCRISATASSRCSDASFTP
jgi:CRP-like cAMP-binding protein